MSQQKEYTLARGFFFSRRENAKDFVVGQMSIKAEDAIKFIEENINENGWLNIDVLWSKDGTKMVCYKNDYKPQRERDGGQEQSSYRQDKSSNPGNTSSSAPSRRPDDDFTSSSDPDEDDLPF